MGVTVAKVGKEGEDKGSSQLNSLQVAVFEMGVGQCLVLWDNAWSYGLEESMSASPGT